MSLIVPDFTISVDGTSCDYLISISFSLICFLFLYSLASPTRQIVKKTRIHNEPKKISLHELANKIIGKIREHYQTRLRAHPHRSSLLLVRPHMTGMTQVWPQNTKGQRPQFVEMLWRKSGLKSQSFETGLGELQYKYIVISRRLLILDAFIKNSCYLDTLARMSEHVMTCSSSIVSLILRANLDELHLQLDELHIVG